MLEVEKCYCPYCGELIEAVIDLSIPEQEYIEDCTVCCRPILYKVSADAISGVISLELRAKDE